MNESREPTVESDDAGQAFRCTNCSSSWYYTRGRCLDCGSSSFETYRLGPGRVVATTTVHATPPGVRTPNHLGLVRFDDGVSLIAQLESSGVSVGESVGFGEIVTLREGDATSIGPQLTTE
ncbi:OB-fold domain-containing protein [Halostagnicola sp. A-GB9-2]|uniref:Zn-ribbon domain-containing OB-fold protein n=1 Tax=Halostagnicola sp. A-GB9-2 TaxID=3048066 RepID=UPI0024C009ED|nr:OB-fold domain-containing protein [Halostagnicola sp. A-GB9-2]MDJ1433706.1 OB-fold domain-containing protein [Halostagnicola sp. A-GB9-2]